MDGFVKLFRSSLDSAVFHNSNLWKVWTYCLMRANYMERTILFNGQKLTLQPGQFITGRYNGADDCNMSPSTFRNQIDKLVELGYLKKKSDNKKSIITVVKWAQFQTDPKFWTPDEHQLDTDKKSKKYTLKSKKEIGTITHEEEGYE